MTLKELHEERERLLLRKEELQTELKQLDAEIKRLDESILSFLQEQGLDRVVLDGRRYEVREETIYTPKDWDALYAWILEHRAPFILQRRLTQKTIEDLANLGDLPDGVEPTNLVRLRAVKA